MDNNGVDFSPFISHGFGATGLGSMEITPLMNESREDISHLNKLE